MGKKRVYILDLDRKGSRPQIGVQAHRNAPREGAAAQLEGRKGYPGLPGTNFDYQKQLMVVVGPVGSLRLRWAEAAAKGWPIRREDTRGRLVVVQPRDYFSEEGIEFSGKLMGDAGRWATRRLVKAIVEGKDIVVDGGTGAFTQLATIIEIGLAFEYGIRPVVFSTSYGICRRRSPGVREDIIRKQVERVDRLIRQWVGFWPSPEVIFEDKERDIQRLRDWGVSIH
jgi:predicted kinase